MLLFIAIQLIIQMYT